MIDQCNACTDAFTALQCNVYTNPPFPWKTLTRVPRSLKTAPFPGVLLRLTLSTSHLSKKVYIVIIACMVASALTTTTTTVYWIVKWVRSRSYSRWATIRLTVYLLAGLSFKPVLCSKCVSVLWFDSMFAGTIILYTICTQLKVYLPSNLVNLPHKKENKTARAIKYVPHFLAHCSFLTFVSRSKPSFNTYRSVSSTAPRKDLNT